MKRSGIRNSIARWCTIGGHGSQALRSFAFALRDRHADTLVRHVDSLRGAVKHERARRPFAIDVVVILPDHVRAVWTGRRCR
jgi:hypothetical protein